MSGIVFVLFLSCVVFLTSSFLSLDQTSVIDFNLLVKFYGLTLYLFTCYLYSRFSENITTNSLQIGEYAYDSVWYDVPIKQQKAIILIVARSQKEFRLTGCGMVDCSLATFLAVIIKFLFVFRYRFVFNKIIFF